MLIFLINFIVFRIKVGKAPIENARYGPEKKGSCRTTSLKVLETIYRHKAAYLSLLFTNSISISLSSIVFKAGANISIVFLIVLKFCKALREVCVACLQSLTESS